MLKVETGPAGNLSLRSSKTKQNSGSQATAKLLCVEYQDQAQEGNLGRLTLIDGTTKIINIRAQTCLKISLTFSFLCHLFL